MASTSTFASEFSAASAGQTICLASGDYGSFKGASKPGTVTITEQPGASASMSISFAGASNIAIDGLTVRGGTITGATKNITIRNSAFTSATTIDGLANANVLFDHDTFNNINAGGQFDSPARIHLSYSSSTHSGVTIQNSIMDGGSADGVQSGVGVNIINNEFTNIREGSCSACHTDAIQLIGAAGSLVQGNWLHNNQDGITAFDGLTNATIVDNAIGPQQSDPDCIDMYALKNSLIAHNSCTSGMDIWLDHKDADPASTGNTIRDNFAPRGLAGRDVSSNTRTNNLTNPTYQGGTAPTSYTGFKLAPNSAGVGTATDGGDVGIRFGD
jgi:hypothetical protein